MSYNIFDLNKYLFVVFLILITFVKLSWKRCMGPNQWRADGYLRCMLQHRPLEWGPSILIVERFHGCFRYQVHNNVHPLQDGHNHVKQHPRGRLERARWRGSMLRCTWKAFTSSPAYLLQQRSISRLTDSSSSKLQSRFPYRFTFGV